MPPAGYPGIPRSGDLSIPAQVTPCAMVRPVETSRTLTTRLTAEAFGADLDHEGKRSWSVHGDCSSPVELRLAGRPDAVLVGLGIEPDKAHVGYMTARCRKCEECLAHRSNLWSARAIAETRSSTRTWFGTITVAPEHRVKFSYAAQLRASRMCVAWGELSEAERFLRIANQVKPHLTLFLKRVRKNSGPFRYLFVLEAHKDGFPHFHVLVHEHCSAITKRVLDGAWKLGFTQFRLVDEGKTGPAFYVCKYLAKSALARVRASQDYGQAGPRLAAQRLIGVVETIRENVVSDKTRLSLPPVP